MESGLIFFINKLMNSTGSVPNPKVHKEGQHWQVLWPPFLREKARVQLEPTPISVTTTLISSRDALINLNWVPTGGPTVCMFWWAWKASAREIEFLAGNPMNTHMKVSKRQTQAKRHKRGGKETWRWWPSKKQLERSVYHVLVYIVPCCLCNEWCHQYLWGLEREYPYDILLLILFSWIYLFVHFYVVHDSEGNFNFLFWIIDNSSLIEMPWWSIYIYIYI
jgi:hypothetical protein